jgi:hypothetical protein
MSMNLNNINELIDIALKTKNLAEISVLSKHPSLNVRRSLAKNINLSQDTLNYLINDPVQNVSYIAFKNPNNSNFEKFFESELRPCITCEKNEKELFCQNCDLVKDHNF